MNREEIVRICEQEVLDAASRVFGTSKDRLGKFDDYEGCTNLVYHYEHDGQPKILRISYRPDRSFESIRAELHFINYLSEGGVRLSKPTTSEKGNLVEVIHAAGIPFKVVSFDRGRGLRIS